MVRFIALLKRREDMSLEDFQLYYEAHHSKLLGSVGSAHASGATGYTRAYLRPAPHPIDQATMGVDYDCIMELTYPDREGLDADMAILGSDGIKPIFAEDEERLFDRRYSRCYVVDEDLSGAPVPPDS